MVGVSRCARVWIDSAVDLGGGCVILHAVFKVIGAFRHTGTQLRLQYSGESW